MNPQVGRTDGERIAVLESQFSDIKNEIINLRSDIKALAMTTDKVLATKITDHSKMESEIQMIRLEIIELQKGTNFWKFASPTLAAVFGSILTFLLLAYLQHPQIP